MTPARFRWGTLLITVGLLLLLRNIGVLHDDVWLELVVWLPAVLIAIGIEKIFTKSRLQIVAYASSVALFALALTIALRTSSTAGAGSYFEQSAHRVEFDPSVSAIKAELSMNNTNLTIRDSGTDIVWSRFDRFTRKPKISYRTENDTAFLSYGARDGSYLGGAIKINVGDEQDWYVSFSDQLPLDLYCSADNADLHLNLATTPLNRLVLAADETSIYLKLGDLEPLVKITVRGQDNSLKLRLPEGLGLLVKGDEYATYLSRLGLERGNGGLMTEGFDDADVQLEMELEDELTSFSVDFF
ncbi:MAG: DUF5668 domain-containing protein [bacterium]